MRYVTNYTQWEVENEHNGVIANQQERRSQCLKNAQPAQEIAGDKIVAQLHKRGLDTARAFVEDVLLPVLVLWVERGKLVSSSVRHSLTSVRDKDCRR